MKFNFWTVSNCFFSNKSLHSSWRAVCSLASASQCSSSAWPSNGRTSWSSYSTSIETSTSWTWTSLRCSRRCSRSTLSCRYRMMIDAGQSIIGGECLFADKRVSERLSCCCCFGAKRKREELITDVINWFEESLWQQTRAYVRTWWWLRRISVSQEFVYHLIASLEQSSLFVTTVW